MEAAVAPNGGTGGGDDPNRRNKGREPMKPHYNPVTRKFNQTKGNQTKGRQRQSKGRQRIKMEKIQDEEARLSTFSKRRSGIYKKANELITLTDAHLGLAMITPAGRVFSFAHPSIENIIDRFLTQHYAQKNQQQLQQQQFQPPVQLLPQQQIHGFAPLQQMMMHQGEGQRRVDVAETILEAHRKVRVNALNSRHDRLVEALEEEKEKSVALMQITRPFENPDGSAKDDADDGWWSLTSDQNLTDEDVDRLSEEIQNFMIEIRETRKNRELRNTMMAPRGADEAGPSHPPAPPPLMQGYEAGPTYPPLSLMRGYEVGLSYPPPLPMQGFMMDNNISDHIVPPARVDEALLAYNLPLSMPGIMGNGNVHGNPDINAGRYIGDEEDLENLAERYFNGDEGPRAGDF